MQFLYWTCATIRQLYTKRNSCSNSYAYIWLKGLYSLFKIIYIWLKGLYSLFRIIYIWLKGLYSLFKIIYIWCKGLYSLFRIIYIWLKGLYSLFKLIYIWLKGLYSLFKMINEKKNSINEIGLIGRLFVTTTCCKIMKLSCPCLYLIFC